MAGLKWLLTNKPSDVVWFILENARRFEWIAQGVGFLRTSLSKTQRLHIWHSSLCTPNVSDIHDHLQWSFRSTILCGKLDNYRYERTPNGELFHEWRILCGVNGCVMPHSHRIVSLKQQVPEVYSAGMSYEQDRTEIHRTSTLDGTVTFLEQVRHKTNEANVFTSVHPDQPWVSANPYVVDNQTMITTVVQSAMEKMLEVL